MRSTRDTAPIFTDLNSDKRYKYRSIASISGFVSCVPYKYSSTFRCENGRRLWLQFRIARPMICSRRFILYHGSRIWTCRIFLKSRPSLPATEIMTTFTFSPCVLFSLVSAFNSKRLSGEIVGSPVITEYRAGRKG